MDKIQNYALIGNGRSAALVSQKGSLDWLCWPRFDSPSIFGAILDENRGGFWKIEPSEYSSSQRQYLEETNVLQTRFFAPSGIATLTDFMTALSEEEKQKTLQPENELIRLLECEEGEIEVTIQFYPRKDYGRLKVHLRKFKKFGLCFKIKQHLFTLSSTIPFSFNKESASAIVTLRKGDKIPFFFSCERDAPSVFPAVEQFSAKLKSTLSWWTNWANQCQYRGPYRQEVIRSALALKLLSFAPSGAFIAAPTTSLPEKINGDLNWDYRFCWLRDASFTVHALFSLGYIEDADVFVSWLLHSTRLNLPKLKVLYDIYGRDPGKEKILSYLHGYFGSKPVRISNAAKDQFQLDCYGEVIDAVFAFVKKGGKLDSETKKMLRLFGKYICKHWKEMDNGIWEIREKKQHYTYSKVMCWVALDRLIKLNQPQWIRKSLLSKFIENRDNLREEIEKKGWNEQLQTYTEVFEGSTLDISLILMAFYGFEKPDSPRMLKTYEKIKERLVMPTFGLTYRGEKSLKDQEGAFVMCSFWIPQFLAVGGGTLREAKSMFEKLLSLANDVGLYSEEIDPDNQDALGNFPQAFTHIALINAALAITNKENSHGLE